MRIAVFASHNGSDLQAVIDGCKSGAIPAEVCVVISNNSSSFAMERARREGIPAKHISGKTHPDEADFAAAVLATLKEAEADMVMLCGYMKKMPEAVIDAYEGRIYNIHPALLPKHGGPDMYGIHVHEAVIREGDKESGVTIHRVSNVIDGGEIVAQATVPVLEGDTPEVLAARVLEREHTFLVEVLSDICRKERRRQQMDAFGRLLDILDELRVKCPWDRVQTNESLRPNTIEEVYELSDALLNEDEPNICKELGDVLLHVVFYAKIGDEQGQFDIKDVCDRLCDKLIFRHPHVFGEVKVNGTGEVLQNWEQLKLKEKGGNKRTLSGVPQSLPSLIKAYRIQEKAQNVGFDWDSADGAWDKLQEEFGELREAMAESKANGSLVDAEGEFGDLLFSAVNVGRLSGLNPDTALERTNQKFTRRFSYVEEKAIEQGRNLKDMTLPEMDVLWEEAKKKE